MSKEEDFLSWDKIHKDSKILAGKLNDRDWIGIVAITRGGMIPACLVARELDIKLIETFCIATYTHDAQDREDIPKALSLPDGGAGWLVIDDLVDSGKTFEIIRTHIPNAFYACLYAKPTGAPQADLYLDDFSQDIWVHFPWELDAETGKPQGI